VATQPVNGAFFGQRQIVGSVAAWRHTYRDGNAALDGHLIWRARLFGAATVSLLANGDSLRFALPDAASDQTASTPETLPLELLNCACVCHGTHFQGPTRSTSPDQMHPRSATLSVFIHSLPLFSFGRAQIWLDFMDLIESQA